MRIKKAPPAVSVFDEYCRSLPQEETARIGEFFRELRGHALLPHQEQARMEQDFQQALLYYATAHLALDEALARLDVKNLGGFYARPPILWYALDDAAKIYPLSLRQGQMAVFRLSVYLKEPVSPELLQIALSFTIKRFPSFATTVKKGFFWHYLDTAKRRFVIGPDTGLPCRPLQVAASGSQSFRVMYYDNRISVEFFHVLTDGSGGMAFLTALTAEYLRLQGVSCPPAAGLLRVNDTPAAEETANEFHRAAASGGSGFVDQAAVQMSGRLSAVKPYQIWHFRLDAAELKSAAQGYGCTVTAYVLAQLFLAGRYATDEQQGEMNIQVPVNMRKFYPSATVRNFSLYCGVRLPLSAITTAAEILPEITRQLNEKASQEAMSRMMSATQSLVRAIRYVPLFIKEPVARLVYGFLGDKIFSNTLSNLGVVKLPPELAAHVDGMDFVLGTAKTNRAGCSLVTCNGAATLSIAKNTADPSFEERLLELLTDDHLTVSVEGSAPYEI